MNEYSYVYNSTESIFVNYFYIIFLKGALLFTADLDRYTDSSILLVRSCISVQNLTAKQEPPPNEQNTAAKADVIAAQQRVLRMQHGGAVN